MKKTALLLPDFRRLVLLGSTAVIAAAMLVSGPARPQALEPVESILDPAELIDLVSPIALYPDDILAVVLPASTFPLDIVRAARFLRELEDNPDLEPDEAWDESVIALLNYPEILLMMDEDLDWTWALGEAVLTDREAVLAATQDFRRQAYAAGNLQSDDKQIVVDSEDVIEITPTDPEVVYIPVYEPQEVIVYNTRPVYSYYPTPYPVYYYPYPSGYFFPSSYFWGVGSYFSIGWHSHLFHVHHYSHRLHPYYLNSYYLYRPYYYRNDIIVTTSINNYTNVWRPANTRRGDRPRTITTEGRADSARGVRTSAAGSQPTVSTSSGGGVGRVTSSAGATTSTRRGVTSQGSTSSTRNTATRDTAAIGGVVEQSTTRSEAARAGIGRTRQLTQPSTSQSNSTNSSGSTRIGRIQTGAPTSGVTTSTRSSTRTAPAGTTTRSSGNTLGGVSRPAPTPAPRSAPSPSTRSTPRSAPAPAPRSAPRSAPAPTRSAPRAAPAPTPRSAPAPRAAPAPTPRSAPAPRAAPAPAPRAAPSAPGRGGPR